MPGACHQPVAPQVLPGVSQELAQMRKQQIEEVRYRLHFFLPEQQDQPVRGSLELEVKLAHTRTDLVLDVQPGAISQLLLSGKELQPRLVHDHLLISRDLLQKGANHLKIAFTAADPALNRNAAYLYTLFVPNKASTVFPCFDQPDIKARYELSLDIPAGWVAVSNAPLRRRETRGARAQYYFAPTLPISTYHFAFTAGKFHSLSSRLQGREFTLYHLETDTAKVQRNAATIFELHAQALQWMESYTAIAYPFQKFDMVLIPAFQFGGMEHPGAIFYKARLLFLEENAGIGQKLRRNSIIAHETAHNWFGNLVTMKWFNDVWLKEVFANFMAAKMVHPNFPEVNHQLRFIHSHQPAAYEEDRSAGTHPVQQPLPNLREASLLYGSIIYQKAPVAMKQLESMMGETAFRQGLQAYLQAFPFGNASWDDLIRILNAHTPADLASWSRAWVKEAGMPWLKAKLDIQDGKIKAYSLSLENRSSGGYTWPQQTALVVGKNGNTRLFPLFIDQAQNRLKDLEGLEAPDYILPNGSEMAYGYFQLDPASEAYLLEHLPLLQDEFLRQAAWLCLWEGMLRGHIAPARLMQSLMNCLRQEPELLVLSDRLDNLVTLYWGFFDQQTRLSTYGGVEDSLWQWMLREVEADRKTVFFKTFMAIAQHPKSLQKLDDLWHNKLQIPGLKLTELDHTQLLYELSVRNWPGVEAMLQQQLKRITNPDRKAAMLFTLPALSADAEVRHAFFEGLRQAENRRKEPWVLTALRYLHHPLRAQDSEQYILPSLQMVKEIQQTGGIFFPKAWVQRTLYGHRSAAAARTVIHFIEHLPADYPPKLKNKILQAADLLLRKVRISGQYNALPDA